MHDGIGHPFQRRADPAAPFSPGAQVFREPRIPGPAFLRNALLDVVTRGETLPPNRRGDRSPGWITDTETPDDCSSIRHTSARVSSATFDAL